MGYGNYGSRQSAPSPDSPYAFVPFAGSAPERSPIDKTYGNPSELLTGWLDVHGYVKSRMALPYSVTETQMGSEHRKMNFFRLPNGELAIPGSELRGLLRSVYETASNSCVPFLLDDSKPISMRLPTSAAIKNRGLLVLENGQWQLWSTFDRSIRARSDERDSFRKGIFRGYSTGDPVSFMPLGDYSARLLDRSTGDASEGWIQFSCPVVWPKKENNYYHVHILQMKDLLHTWKDDAPYTVLEQILDKENDSARKALDQAPSDNIRIELLRKLRAIKKTGHGVLPVFYVDAIDSRHEIHYYLSPSSIGRVGQERKWTDILGKYCTCSDSGAVCPACQLFGIINGNLLIRSRLRVGDGHFVGKPETHTVTLPILGGPKPTAFEYYIRQPKETATFWNYDFYSTRNRDQNATFTFREDFSPLGRKYYWHNASTIPVPAEPGKLNITTEYIDKGAEFTFRIHFDRITSQQLQQLKWIINFGENTPESSLQHKLGHAKPYGYGSVKLTIDETVIRRLVLKEHLIVYETEKQEVPEQEVCPFPAKYKATLRSLLTISDSTTELKYRPSYPQATDNKGNMAIYNWYSNNRKINSGHQAPTVLPDIEENARSVHEVRFEESAPVTSENILLGTVYQVNKSILIAKVGFMQYKISLKDYKGPIPKQGTKVKIRATGITAELLE